MLKELSKYFESEKFIYIKQIKLPLCNEKLRMNMKIKETRIENEKLTYGQTYERTNEQPCTEEE